MKAVFLDIVKLSKTHIKFSISLFYGFLDMFVRFFGHEKNMKKKIRNFEEISLNFLNKNIFLN